MVDTLKDIIEGLVVGALAALTIIYAFQTRVVYPDFVLRMWQHPWVFVLFFILAVLMFQWSKPASVLSILMLLALVADVVVFAQQPLDISKETPAERLSHESAALAVPHDEQMIKRVPGVGVTATESGIALSSVPLPVPSYPTFDMSLDDSKYSPF
jgi:hypothetical protein